MDDGEISLNELCFDWDFVWKRKKSADNFAIHIGNKCKRYNYFEVYIIIIMTIKNDKYNGFKKLYFRLCKHIWTWNNNSAQSTVYSQCNHVKFVYVINI